MNKKSNLKKKIKKAKQMFGAVDGVEKVEAKEVRYIEFSVFIDKPLDDEFTARLSKAWVKAEDKMITLLDVAFRQVNSG